MCRAFPSHPPAFAARQAQPTLLYSSTNNKEGSPQPKKKKTKGFSINPNLAAASISSDGILTDRRKNQPARTTSSLGVPTKQKKQPKSTGDTKMSKKDRQRTANGAVDSSLETRIADPANENVQVLQAKRGNKTVTIVRYVQCSVCDYL